MRFSPHSSDWLNCRKANDGNEWNRNKREWTGEKKAHLKRQTQHSTNTFFTSFHFDFGVDAARAYRTLNHECMYACDTQPSHCI